MLLELLSLIEFFVILFYIIANLASYNEIYNEELFFKWQKFKCSFTSRFECSPAGNLPTTPLTNRNKHINQDFKPPGARRLCREVAFPGNLQSGKTTGLDTRNLRLGSLEHVIYL